MLRFHLSAYYSPEVFGRSCWLAASGILLLLLFGSGPVYASSPDQEGSSPGPRIEKLLESLYHLEHAMDALDEAEDQVTLSALRNALWPVLNDLGEAYRQGQQYQSAQDYHRRALDIAREVGSDQGQAASLSGLGQTFYQMEQHQQALDYFEQALSLWQTLGNQHEQAVVLSQMGQSYYRLASYRQAADYFEQVLPLWQALGEREQETDSLDTLGRSLYHLAEYEQAASVFQRALAGWRQVNHPQNEASTLEALGDSYTALEQYPAAAESYAQAQPIWQTLGDSAAEARTLYRLGRAYRALGQYAAAVASLEKVIDRLDQPETKMQALIELGVIRRYTGDYRQAAVYLDQALILQPTIEDAATSARLWQESGIVLSLQGFYPAAREQLEQALSRYQAAGDRRGEADIRAGLGDLFSRTGDYEAAIASYQQALELRRAEKDYQGEIAALRDLGRVLQKRGAYKQALADFLLPALDAARKGDQHAYTILLQIDIAATLGRAGEYKQALEEVEQALALARQENDRAGEAAALQVAGQIYQAMGDGQAALPVYDQARQIFHEMDDRQAAADSLAGSGSIYADLGMVAEALEAYSQALRLKKDSGARPGQADILNRISLVYARLGDEMNALNYAEQARHLWQDMGDSGGQATALHSLSRIVAARGRYSQAIEYAGQAFALWQQVGDQDDQAAILLHLAKLQVDLADYDRAEAYAQEALALHQAGGSRTGQGASHTLLGLINRWMGRYQEAAAFYQQALISARDTGHRQGEAAVLLYLADLATARANYDQARQYGEAALAIHLAGQPAAAAGILNYLGELQRQIGAPHAALSLLEQGLELYREAGDMAGEATSLHLLGLAYLDLKQAGLAGTQLQRALELRLAGGSPDRIAGTLAALGHVQEQQGHPEQAIRLYQQALQVMDLLPIRANRTESSALPAGLGPVYHDLIRLLFEAGRYSEVYQYAEQARHKVFLDQLSQAPPDFGPGLPADVLDQQHILAALQDTLLDLARLRPSAEQRAAVDTAKLKLHESRLAYREALVALDQQNVYASLLLGRILPLPQLQAQLGPQSTLLEYVVLSPEQTLALVVTRAGLKVIHLPLSLSLLNDSLKEFYYAGKTIGPEVPAGLQSLYNQLLKPLEAYLKTEQLYLVPDQQLAAVPFAALHDGRRYLVEQLTLALLPSSSALAQVKLQRQPATGAPLVLGDPAGDLPLAREEARITASLYEVEPYLGREANEQIIRESGPRAPLWQLSTSATYDPANPLLSYLRLAPTPGETDQGRLALHEVYELTLEQVNLVVLPAFNPEEQDMPGAELLAPSRAFIYAGAPSLLTALWPVEDRAALDLKAMFFRQLQAGYRKGTALRLAQLSLLNQPDTAHPYFWAGLVLSGDIGAGLSFPPESQPDMAAAPAVYHLDDYWLLWAGLALTAAASGGALAWLVQQRRHRHARRTALERARQRLLAGPPSPTRTRALRYIEQELARLNHSTRP